MRSTIFAIAFGPLLAFCLPVGAVSVIGFDEIDNARVLDFEALPTGSISASDPAFVGLGISGISATSVSDVYSPRPDSSRALGYTDLGGLEVVDPLADAALNSITFTFIDDITQFGFGVHDEDGPFTVAFQDDGSQVGLYLGHTIGADLNRFAFEVSPFDTVLISFFGGFYVDDLAVSGAAGSVPAPAPLISTGLGLGILLLRRRYGRVR